MEHYADIGTADSVTRFISSPDTSLGRATASPLGRATVPFLKSHGCRPAFYCNGNSLVQLSHTHQHSF